MNGCDFSVPVQRTDAGWALLPPEHGPMVDDVVALAAGLNLSGEAPVFVDRQAALAGESW